jgi:hypothetical protein
MKGKKEQKKGRLAGGREKSWEGEKKTKNFAIRR